MLVIVAKNGNAVIIPFKCARKLRHRKGFQIEVLTLAGYWLHVEDAHQKRGKRFTNKGKH